MKIPVEQQLANRRSLARSLIAAFAVAMAVTLGSAVLVPTSAQAASVPSRAAAVSSPMVGSVVATVPAGCMTPVAANVYGMAFRISFCGTYLLLETPWGARWTESLSGAICRYSPSWLIRAITWGRYSRC
jgi:hypothetical protein